MSKLSPVRGTKDLYGQDFTSYAHIVDIARRQARLYGFAPLATPVMEHAELFSRSLGESSDVVHKEMYSLTSKGGDALVLRPEFTAAVVRSFISNNMHMKLPCKLFSYGPLFRYERPQKGRQRQFHQVNFECFGEASPYADAEVISLAASLLREAGVLEDTHLAINTLGDAESRSQYRDTLVEYLSKYEAELSDDSKRRLKENPLRILDSKDARDREIIADAPRMSASMGDDARRFFETVTEAVAHICPDITIIHDENIVRGLDYYTHTVFEFIAGDDSPLGAQSTVLAGGRYDGLVKQMGGADTPAIGFACGVERLMLMMQPQPQQAAGTVIIPFDQSMETAALEVASRLRARGTELEIIRGRALKKALKKAADMNAARAILITPDEYSKGLLCIRDMNDGTQQNIPLDDLK